MAEKKTTPKPIAVSANPSDEGDYFDFTYMPTTVHLRPRREVSFKMEGGKVDSLLLIFEESPFKSGHKEVVVTRAETRETIADVSGVFHYKALGDAEIRGHRRLIYDLWCPSIIVD